MNVVELFSGSRSIGKEAEKRGHKVFSSDCVDFPNTNYVCDIMDFQVSSISLFDRVDMLWASPPCESFSVASIGHHWEKGHEFMPKTNNAVKGINILMRTMKIIDILLKKNPNMIWYIENPRGKMRKSPHWNDVDHVRHTLTYCQYGDDRMKPTDIWTNNFDWTPKPMCKNGDSCHVSAPRGSQSGTQGRGSYFDRSKIPSELCAEIVESTNNV